MNICFNLQNCGLGNNGGSQTIILSSQTLNDIGHKSNIVTDHGGSGFTWFKHAKPIKNFPNDTDVVIATGCTTVIHTSKLNIPKKYWWIRGHEIWGYPEKKLLSLYNLKNVVNITNSHGLAKRISKLGCTEPCHVIQQGIDLDLWEDLNLRKDNKKIKIGCLYGQKPSKKWSDFVTLSKMLGSDQYEYIGIGSASPPNSSFLSSFAKNASKEKLKEVYSSCDIWFAPTVNEGLHNVPMEASLCGALLVCSNSDYNGMIHDYAFHNRSAFIYSNLDEAVSIIETKKREDNLNIIKESRKIIENDIGSRPHNMKKLIKLIS